MADSDLTPADAAILRYLRTQVDRLQDERWRVGARPSGSRGSTSERSCGAQLRLGVFSAFGNVNQQSLLQAVERPTS